MNTNLIKNQLKRTKQNIFALLLLFSLSLNFACVDSPDDMQVISPNPFGVGIIVFNSVPAQIFGNGIDQDTIKINTGLIPDGSSVTARITGTNLESNVAGCVLSGSANIVNGMATFDFLHPIFIGTPGLVEPVNLAVDIIIPGDDTPDTTVTDFVSLLINAVSITPPGDNAVTPLPLDNPFIEFVDFEFVTTGIPPTSQEPSIFAECMVSNPDLGVVDNTQINGDPNTTPVFGTTEEGRFIAKYFIENGTLGGNQILTCMITLPNPQDIDPGCPNVPENKRKITAELLIEHNPADPTVANDVTCTPNPIIGGNDGFCTCNAANAAGLEICIESGGSTVDIDPSCGTADANGTVVLPFETDVVVEQVIDPVVCTVTEGLPFFAQTNVTVNPAVVNSLICEPNPVESDEALGGDENSLLCTCDTNALQTQICFETVVGDGEINFPEAVDPFCVDSDANGSAIMIADVDGGITEQVDNILECCVDADGDNTCDTNATAQETVTITPFEPPVTSISCTAQQTTLGPDGNTFIDIVIDGFPFAQEVCAQIEIDSEGDATVGPDDDTVESPEVACSITDGNGEASIPFNAPPTIALQRDVTLRCFPDTLPDGAPDGEFTPGEISDIEVITLDPNAGPPPVQVACNVNPGTVEPGEDAFLTATLSNAGVGTDVCFEITTDTNPVSELMDDDEDFANDDIVCSQTNVANQAFATFQADPGILIDDNAIITCCADIGGGAPDGDCAFDDPQTTVNVAVDVPTISIACEPQTNPIGPGDDTFINITTTGVAPDDGMGPDEDVCVTIIGNTAPISEVGTPPSGITACSIVDALGNASIQFRGGDVPVLDVADIRCFVDNLDDGDTFTPGEISVTNQVTVDPNAAPPAPEIACSPNPATVLPGDN
ncbi:MAG: hypothetical protein GWM89_09715, partial [Candidatus Dadabacteria bacterium]|nr:hypothetical protein [Candidatus Dadabacteria bacterium]NIY22678.1 hypothetical protein [Candidatus Dadabacteria bacterium]